MRRVALALLLLGCAPELDGELGGYLDDAEVRARALEDSFVDPSNGYSQLRLERYSSDWASLPESNPPVRPLVESDIGAFVDEPTRETEGLTPVLDEDVVDGAMVDEAALLELGRRAFETYPVQIADVIGEASSDRERLERYGLWVDDRGHVGGLVRVRVPGGERFAVTCATCHSRTDDDGRLVRGATNAAFDWGRITYDAYVERGQDPSGFAHLAEWGAGQVDVTPDGVHNAAAMTDLRATSRHRYLHWAGTLENDVIALAIRLETLIITSSQQTLRPPREVALGLALYVWSLGEGGEPADPGSEPRGAELFAAQCAGCHGADGSVPTPRIRLDVVGTDRAVGDSVMRGTGFYRTPSLWRVAERRQLLHHGAVQSLEELMSPERLETVPGHLWGTDLDEPDRTALLRFVRQIGAQRN